MKKSVLLCFILIFIMVFPNVTFANIINQNEIAEENGRNIGRMSGEISGQRDYINNRKNNWESAYKEEEKRVILLYELEKETTIYRAFFLKGFKEGFKEFYEKTYKELESKSKETPFDYGVSHGSFFGSLLGTTFGTKEYHEGKTNDWRRSVPADRQLIKEYSLNRDTDIYTEGFIIGFKMAYEENYSYAFRHANVENHRLTKEKGFLHGEIAGEKQGVFLGKMDFIDGKANDWKLQLPTDQKITLQANLLKENPQYREGFLAGYKEGFKKGYIETYQQANLTSLLENTNYVEVSMLGNTINTSDNMLTCTIKPGTFYWDTFISLEKEVKPVYLLNTPRLEATTNKYIINVANHLGYVSLKEPITLEFKYFGTERAGIYQLVEGEWRYLFSKIEGNTISTMIPNGTYSGGEYAVFIDDTYPLLKDIYTHWAREELYTFVRRYYVSGYTDGTVRPSEKVSRGEFVTLLSRVLKWNFQNNNSTAEFNDVKEFGVHGKAIFNAVEKGYIKGYPDNTFKPNNYITYQEIEWIMQRIVKGNSFLWLDIEEQMLYEKYTRSQSIFSMNYHITRGEIIYMLHQLQNRGKL